jgi:hypothetical protein
MALYFPVTTSEHDSRILRRQTEGVLTGNSPVPINDRIQELDLATRELGAIVTFGAEVEFQFVLNPLQSERSQQLGVYEDQDIGFNRAELYYSVLNFASGVPFEMIRSAKKGEIVEPSVKHGSVLRSRHQEFKNHEGQDDSIIEIQTAPSRALEAHRRYWRVIQAIGKTAEKWGLMGLISSTHLSAVISRKDEFGESPLHPVDSRMASYLAGVQHNLIHMQRLQLDSGLEEGYVALEAFPDKSSSTSVYGSRIEIRHPVIGLADVRLGTLAVLHGSLEAAKGETPELAQQRVVECSKAGGGAFKGPSHREAAADGLVTTAVIDKKTGQLVAPADVDRSAWSMRINENYDMLVEVATAGRSTDAFVDNGALARRVIGDIRYRGGEFLVKPDSEYAEGLSEILPYMAIFRLKRSLRTKPELLFDSPELHLEYRKNIKKSSRVRDIFGSALTSVVSGDESVARRKAMIDSQVVELNLTD